MDIELNEILDYILKKNNIPLKGLKNTKRNLISLFGKDTLADVSFSETDISILLLDSEGSTIMSIYHEESMDYILCTIYKNEEINHLSYFKNKNEAYFKLSLKNKEIKITDAEEFSYIV